ncbi:hypothetical protein CALCODRAFT_505487 [Calocera cornea HHB12733]|uniref:Uncharacterized protein n=1 Tax=Calocera cornea HHB12733 TaxID=1353952 RepID=A0A165K695_9BASI|nr:hypothetical protein CALCODRAFT_505487 [Calocera cornea HHB12733]
MSKPHADDVMESQLYSLLARHDQIESVVPNIDTVVPRLLAELGGYQASTKAKVKVSSLVFMSDLSFTFEGIKKTFEGKNVGVPLVGGGCAYGTLYYNDLRDLEGKCELQIITTILALNINFLHSGKTFATFIGMMRNSADECKQPDEKSAGVYPGLSAANGIFSGQGKWSSDA